MPQGKKCHGKSAEGFVKTEIHTLISPLIILITMVKKPIVEKRSAVKNVQQKDTG
jgi:hypothetical protein